MPSIPDPECPSCGSIEMGRPDPEDEEGGAEYQCHDCGDLARERGIGQHDLVPHNIDPRTRGLTGDAGQGMLVSDLFDLPPKPRIQRVFHDRRG